MSYFSRFDQAIRYAEQVVMNHGREVDTGTWQGVSTEGQPSLVTREVIGVQLDVPMDRSVPFMYPDELIPILAEEINPNLPWADDHFAERVSRDPSNPGEEYKNWPWWRGQEDTTKIKSEKYEEHQGEDFKFTHTYQERFWPKHAGDPKSGKGKGMGIRYRYGDLDDVVNLLFKEPYTRQATFPIFFPEDTGAVHGGRIPCTLHYHFLLRAGQLHCWYPIRSCDLVRHFRDDIYLACKLVLWVLAELVQKELRSDKKQIWVDVNPGTLWFTAYSLHVHKGDMHLVPTR